MITYNKNTKSFSKDPLYPEHQGMLVSVPYENGLHGLEVNSDYIELHQEEFKDLDPNEYVIASESPDHFSYFLLIYKGKAYDLLRINANKDQSKEPFRMNTEFPDDTIVNQILNGGSILRKLKKSPVSKTYGPGWEIIKDRLNFIM